MEPKWRGAEMVKNFEKRDFRMSLCPVRGALLVEHYWLKLWVGQSMMHLFSTLLDERALSRSRASAAMGLAAW